MRRQQMVALALVLGFSPLAQAEPSVLEVVPSLGPVHGSPNARLEPIPDRLLAQARPYDDLFEPNAGPELAPARTGSFEDAQDAWLRHDYATALRYCRPLAAQGNARAQFLLGFMYDRGDGVAQDYAQAVNWYRKAAEQGEAKAQRELGGMYDRGRGVARDYTQAVYWYRKAAAQRDILAQHYLGFMFESGRGVARDYVQAVYWYRKAAEQGLERAQFHLGIMYAAGDGVAQDYAQAVYWLRQAAEQRSPYASFRQAILAELYNEGQDYVEAHMWYNIAAASGEPGAARNRDAVARRMTASQLALAQAKAREWLEAREHQASAAPPHAPTLPEVEPPEARVERRPEPAPEPRAEPRSLPRPEPRLAPRADPPTEKATPPAFTGTGFVVTAAQGAVVTNAHVVQGCRSLSSPQVGPLRVIAKDETSDLALLRATPAANQAQARLRGGRGLRAGENVTVFGYPLVGLLSDDPKLTTGVVSGLSGLRNDRRLIQITAPVQPGNSGGPLLDQNGRVVGVVVGKLNALAVAKEIGDLPQNINFAISLGTLQSFLDSNDVLYAVDASTVIRPTEDIAAEARDYTVLIECRH